MNEKEGLYRVNQLAATYFRERLREQPHFSSVDPTLTIDGGTIDTFGIGYAPATGLATFLEAQGAQDAAEVTGLLTRRSGHAYGEPFRHRLMFPLVDVDGRVVGFCGRSVGPLPDENVRVKYIHSPDSNIYTPSHELFGLYHARDAISSIGNVTVVEGNVDVVSLHARGLSNVVAPLGTTFTIAHARLLKRFVQTAVFLFDGDAAGDHAVRLAREVCRSVGLESKAATLPAGTNAVGFSRTEGINALKAIIRAAA